MSADLIELEKRLSYTFKDKELLLQALRHRSAGSCHNERLEFLGDAVLGFIVSAELYRRKDDAPEGDLSRLRSSLVNKETLAQLGLTLGLPDFIELGLGEQKNGGNQRQSIVADTLEALIGAIYLDAGLDVVCECILRLYSELVADLALLTPDKDAKTRLQEWLQARSLPLPSYTVEMEGKAHALTFKVMCQVEGLPFEAWGESTSRRKAEQVAAEVYLGFLDDEK